MACIAPRPRTSPTIGQRFCHCRARFWKRSPSSLARASKFSSLEYVEHRQRGRAGKRIAGKCAAQAAGAGRIHDFRAAGDGRQRKSAAERFRGHDNVRLDAVVFAGKQVRRCGRNRSALRRR